MNQYNSSWGWDMLVVAEAFENAIRNYLAYNKRANDEISLIIHDWGSFLGLALYRTLTQKIKENPSYNAGFTIKRIASIEIGDGNADNDSLAISLIKPGYQTFLATMFLSPYPIGLLFTRLFVKAARAPLARQKRVYIARSNMNYLYLYRVYRQLTFQSLSLSEVPSVPVFFAYGNNPLLFHTFSNWRKNLLERVNNGCFYKKYEKSVHWLQTENKEDRTLLTNDLKSWLKKTQSF